MSPRTVPREPETEAERLTTQRFDGAQADWDGWVAGAEGSSFCHLGGWRAVMQDVLGHEPIYTVALGGDGTWRGVLPAVRVNSRLFGRYDISMPFLNYGGPLGSAAARRLLAENAVKEASAGGARLLELRARHPVPGPLAPASRKVTVTLPLPGSVEELWSTTFRAKLRSQIRRPLKEGMTVTFGDEHVDAFYEVFAHNMRDLGTPVLPYAFFARLARELAGYVEYGVVWSGARPVAAGCGFLWSGEFEMTWASSLRAFNRSAPNMLLYGAFMERSIGRGVRVFNFGRCTPGGGTHRFKLQWGGADEPLPWAVWSAAGATSPPSSERPLYRLATAAWQRLPLSLANRLGPPLARGLP